MEPVGCHFELVGNVRWQIAIACHFKRAEKSLLSIKKISHP